MQTSILTRTFTAWILGAAATLATAQVPPPPLQNVVQLSASGSVQTPQDWLTLSLSTTVEASDAQTVQNQLKVALETALADARKAAAPDRMNVRTGNFSLYPRNTRDGKINGWQGRAELVLEGRDFALISTTAGRLQTLTLGQAAFSLSREQRDKVEGEAQAAAIRQFKKRAAEIARGFGFEQYTLRELSVSGNDQGPMPRPRLMAMEARSAASDAPIPVEAGMSQVMVTVSGTVQLR